MAQTKKKNEGVTLSEILNDRADTVIDLKGFKLKVTYLPNQVTMKNTIDSSRASQQPGFSILEEIADQLSKQIVSWNLIDEATGDPLPIEYDTFLALPTRIALMIANGLTDPEEVVGEAGGSFGGG